MARGWESKSIEAQIESAETSESSHHDHQDPERLRQRQALVLSRSRVLQQLEVSLNPRHREMLNHALADLEAQLARLD